MKQTLGFLKKKRTKESSANDSASQPTSPITPTTSRGFDNLIDDASINSTQSSTKENPAVAGDQHSMPLTTHHQPALTEKHNSPTINNLIHPPQHDGAGQSHQSEILSSTGSNSGQQPAVTHMPAQEQTQIRQTKGKYSLVDFELLRTLGTGSFGRVHLVQSKHNQRFYAVKVLKKQQVVKMKQVEHTNDERRMLQEVKHPFLITLWGTFQDSKNLYMVMDFVEGGELFSLLRKSQVCYIVRTFIRL